MCSDYFANVFERTPCKHPVIVLRDVSSRDFEFLLSYMYSGEVSVSQVDLPSLIRNAEALQIKGLAAPDDMPQNLNQNSSKKQLRNSENGRFSSESPRKKSRLESDLSLSPLSESSALEVKQEPERSNNTCKLPDDHDVLRSNSGETVTSLRNLENDKSTSDIKSNVCVSI